MKRRILLVVAAAVALWAAQTAWRGSPAGAEEGTFLSFVSEPGDLIGQGHSLAFTPANSSIAAVALADLQEVHVSIFPFAGSFWILDMAAPAGQQLVPGVYEGATRWPLQAPSLPGLSFYGDGRGCNTLTGRFEVLEVVYEPSGLVDHFHTTFEQHCEGAEAPALFGEVMLINPPPPDSDGDGVTDEVDNCVFPANTDQADRDGDGIGDACDLDNDNDGFEDSIELSTGSDPLNPASTPEQSFVAPSSCTDSLDNDLDSLIDGEDSGCDGDGDGVLDTIDNCLSIPNPDQADRDEDGIGDA